MTEPKIDIRSGSLFPWHFQLIAVFIFIAGITLFIQKPLVGSILVLASGFMLSASAGIEIDKAKNKYREYMSFYFILKNGKWRKFTGAEKVFINNSQVSSAMHTAHTNHSAVFKNTEYNAYLKLSDGTKIHLLSSKKKEKLVATMNKAASFLNTPVQDNTVNYLI
jgi:hypothetical protein